MSFFETARFPLLHLSKKIEISIKVIPKTTYYTPGSHTKAQWPGYEDPGGTKAAVILFGFCSETDVQCSVLVLNFNTLFLNVRLYWAGRSMNSLPLQILERHIAKASNLVRYGK